jgi:hypothetical protein
MVVRRDYDLVACTKPCFSERVNEQQIAIYRKKDPLDVPFLQEASWSPEVRATACKSSRSGYQRHGKVMRNSRPHLSLHQSHRYHASVQTLHCTYTAACFKEFSRQRYCTDGTVSAISSAAVAVRGGKSGSGMLVHVFSKERSDLW